MRFVWLLVLFPCALAARPLAVPTLPPSAFADTESVTNIVFDAGNADSRLFRLSLELDATSDNNVSVAFGTDENENGVLDREEVDADVGWDSGSWYFRDRTVGSEVHVDRQTGHRRLEWELAMTPCRTAKSVKATDADGVVFTGSAPSTMFNPAWNLMKVTARGLTEPDGIVVNEVRGRGFVLIMR